MVAAIRSVGWPPSDRNTWPPCVGIRISPRMTQRPNYLPARAAGVSPPKTSCASWPRPIAPPRPAGTVRSRLCCNRNNGPPPTLLQVAIPAPTIDHPEPRCHRRRPPTWDAHPRTPIWASMPRKAPEAPSPAPQGWPPPGGHPRATPAAVYARILTTADSKNRPSYRPLPKHPTSGQHNAPRSCSSWIRQSPSDRRAPVKSAATTSPAQWAKNASLLPVSPRRGRRPGSTRRRKKLPRPDSQPQTRSRLRWMRCDAGGDRRRKGAGQHDFQRGDAGAR